MEYLFQPFYYLFINTISSNDLVKKGMINFYPKGLNIDNYLKLREVGDLGNAFLVSLRRERNDTYSWLCKKIRVKDYVAS